MLRPRHRPQDALHELGPPTRLPGKNLHDLAAQLLRVADLARRAAAGAVGNAAAVADLGDVGIEHRPDDELRAVGDVDAGGRRIDDRADAHDHARVRLVEMTRDFVEDVRREIAAVGELDALGAAVGAGLDDLRTDLDIRMIEHGDDPLIHHRGQNLQPVPGHVYASFCGPHCALTRVLLSCAKLFNLSSRKARVVRLSGTHRAAWVWVPDRRDAVASLVRDDSVADDAHRAVIPPSMTSSLPVT